MTTNGIFRLDGRIPITALPTWARLLNFALTSALLALLFVTPFFLVQYTWNWGSVSAWHHLFLKGWVMTLGISLAALVLSLIIGLAFALAGRSNWLMLRYLNRIYVELVRGTPLLVQIAIAWYVIAEVYHVEYRTLVGVLVLSVFSGAYIAEIIRAGIESVGKSQLDSARAIGLTPSQTFRFVVFPQALRRSLPPLAGQFVSLIKDSSLLFFISIDEFTKNALEVHSFTFSSFECYIPLAVGYLILTLPISLWTQRLEARHAFET